MLLPLFLLGGGALFAGYVWHEYFVGAEAGAVFWRGSIAYREHLAHAMHEVPAWVVWTPSVAFFLGLGAAWYAYLKSPELPARVAGAVPALYRFLTHKWYFDELYDALFVRPSFAIGRFLWARGDQQTIDRLGPDGAAAAVASGARAARRFQSGYVYSYALVMLVGLAALAAWVLPGAMTMGGQ
jgi:NADH-quinone oxidoreductase subunit L